MAAGKLGKNSERELPRGVVSAMAARGDEDEDTNLDEDDFWNEKLSMGDLHDSFWDKVKSITHII